MGAYCREDICAVIVSYHPEAILLKNMESLLPQVGRCLIVDNGSGPSQILDEAGKKENVELLELGENKGIAYALNQGLEYCEKNGFPLLLTMDQDTVLARNAVAELLKAMNGSEAKSVGINWDGKAMQDKSVKYLITSGNLVEVKVARAVGGYDEEMFIDSVDFDFSLKLKESGVQILKVAGAHALHQLGEQQSAGYSTHSVERYYYIYRNHFYLIRKHKKKQRAFCAKKQLALGLDCFRILLFDKQKKEKYGMLIRGYRDAKKMGSPTGIKVGE